MPTDASDPRDDAARAALALLRASTTATLLVGPLPRPVRYALDPRNGRPILPVEARDLDAGEWTLCLPDDSFETRARVVLDLEPLDEHDEAVDRFAAYHGRSTAAAPWASGRIAFVKLADGPVVDGEALMVPNALLGAQTPLCRLLNADPSALRTACARSTGVAPEEPVGVGVDPMGIDVRARFGVVRADFASPADDADAAARRITAWLRGDPA